VRLSGVRRGGGRVRAAAANDRAWSRRERKAGGGALSQSGEATARLWGRDAARGTPSGSESGLRGRRLGFSAYCLHCFIVLFDPRLLVSCDVSCWHISAAGKLLARWLEVRWSNALPVPLASWP
jgi:hypothetical protein